MSQPVCRWGLLGTAAISRKNWKAIRLSGNGRVAAVASRSKARAQEFIQECAAEVPALHETEAVGSYEALIGRGDIDAVYVPLPTGIRKEWVIAAANAGKHVLCEKPAAVNAADASDMIAACSANQVQFMDGVMFDHSQRLKQILDSLSDPDTIGKLRRIQTHFSFAGDETFQQTDIRTDSSLEPHGCLGDLGWYCIRFTLWASGLRMPTHVSARTITTLQGKNSVGEVPAEFSAEMQFDDGLTAAFYCSFVTDNQQTALLSGDGGYLSVDDFVLPFYDAEAAWNEHQHVLEIDNCRWHFRRHSVRRAIFEYGAGEPNAQEVAMVRKLADVALAGKTDPLYPDLAIKTQRILDACRRSAMSSGELTAI